MRRHESKCEECGAKFMRKTTAFICPVCIARQEAIHLPAPTFSVDPRGSNFLIKRGPLSDQLQGYRRSRNRDGSGGRPKGGVRVRQR